MKIEMYRVPKQTIADFADRHALVMEVHERSSAFKDSYRFYAHFSRCEVQGPGILVGVHGDGRTPNEAIADYAERISTRTLVVDGYESSRRVIVVPRLVVPRLIGVSAIEEDSQ